MVIGKYKIDAAGHLIRVLDGKEINLFCPFSPGHDYCGVWCPHFRFPVPHKDFAPDPMYNIKIGLCHGTELVCYSEEYTRRSTQSCLNLNGGSRDA